jgi:hypothetical protein
MCVVGCAPARVSPAADVASGRSGHRAVLASGRQAHRRWLGRHALHATAGVCARHLSDAWVDTTDGSVSFHDVENGEACARCVRCVRINSPLLSCVTALSPCVSYLAAARRCAHGEGYTRPRSARWTGKHTQLRRPCRCVVCCAAVVGPSLPACAASTETATRSCLFPSYAHRCVAPERGEHPFRICFAVTTLHWCCAARAHLY